jgi:hypothetical protein
MWVKKEVKGRFNSNIWALIKDEKERAKNARKTGVSVSRRAIKEFGIAKR